MSETVLDLIKQEYDRQRQIGNSNDDASNTKNDWIGAISAYVGRAADKVHRNNREGQTFRENLVKVAALAISALEAHDRGEC